MVRLAVAQSPAGLDKTEDRIAWLRDALPDLTAKSIDLVLLPELFLCGYNIGDTLADRAEPADGPGFEAMRDLAQTSGIALHYGFAEADGTHLYNSALCISPDGTVLTHQRKLGIPPGFEQTHFTPGVGCSLFSYRGMRFATLICYDAEFPETVRHVASLGAEVVLVPTALGAQWGWVAHTMIPCRAYENGVYLAYANSAGSQNGMEFLGASVIAAPGGAEAVRAGSEPEVIFADLDRAKVQAAQARLPYLKDRLSLKLT
ncbi:MULTISPECIES: carbon-nitrogen hydrolase family protein [Marivita]|uniref:carbon-nitrogen hydrolase family protein n=1 Tax=Marivita TaxID=659428 RepID=UPI001EEF16C6|nr:MULTISPECIES: carbon-nitrogen hydrolase family protein [Marivita]MCR9170483.1 carbon-nitrogen hydrolase family protein [Paracoccaceae bacterium]